MRNDKLVFAALSIFLFICIPTLNFAANMHILMVGDTQAEELRESIEEDLLNIKNEMFIAASVCGLSFKESTYIGTEATPKNIIRATENLNIEEGDVAVFYFSGHGYRVPSKLNSPWPNMAFTSHYQGLDLDDILNILREKKPRMILAIADCCNNYIPDILAPFLIRREFDLRSVKPWMKKNYEELFVQTTGEVIVSASKPGLYAWSTTGGGLYTIAFLSSLHTEVSQKDQSVSWQHILDRAAYIIQDNQTPEYLYQEAYPN